MMNELDRVFAWAGQSLDSILKSLRSQPADVLLIAAGFAVLLFLVAAAASAKRARRLERALHATQEELEEVRAKYQSELKWRRASDRSASQRKTPA